MAYTAWAATTSYAVGAIVRATTVQDFGLVFKCTTAGTSGATAPAWPTLINATTNDGTVTWTAVSAVFEDLNKLEPNAIIELFQLQLDATLHGSSDIYYFHNGVNADVTGNVVWNGQSYIRLPLKASGFDYTSSGSLPRPTLTVSNIGSSITALLLQVNLITPGNDLGGAKVVRIRTLKKYLDGEATADPHAKFPDEIWYVDRKSSETRAAVEFELASKFDLAGIMLPKRQIVANICQWKYRGAECGYNVAQYYDVNDNLAASAINDVCGKKLSSCNIRFAPFTSAGTVTQGSNLLNVTPNTQLAVGQAVSGFGIPASTVINAVASGQLTLNQSATTSTASSQTCTVAVASASLQASNPSNIAVGMTVSGSYLPGGTYVTGISGSTVSLNNVPVESVRSGTYTVDVENYFYSYWDETSYITFQAIELDITGLYVGMAVFGSNGINTTIAGIEDSFIYLNSYGDLSFDPTGVTLYFITPTPSAASYSFSAGSQVYTFRNPSATLPFGSFPGAGLVQ